jgi:hypothetical protein
MTAEAMSRMTAMMIITIGAASLMFFLFFSQICGGLIGLAENNGPKYQDKTGSKLPPGLKQNGTNRRTSYNSAAPS